MKNCDLGHSFSLYGPPSRQIIYISSVYKKVNNQSNVMIRFTKLIYKDILVKLYKAFIQPHCDVRNTEKLAALNKRCLRLILDDI